MTEQNSKWDLIWIIPEIIGVIGICFLAIWKISSMTPIESSTLDFLFNACLAMIVLKELGFAGIGHAFDELKKVKW